MPFYLTSAGAFVASICLLGAHPTTESHVNDVTGFYTDLEMSTAGPQLQHSVGSQIDNTTSATQHFDTPPTTGGPIAHHVVITDSAAAVELTSNTASRMPTYEYDLSTNFTEVESVTGGSPYLSWSIQRIGWLVPIGTIVICTVFAFVVCRCRREQKSAIRHPQDSDVSSDSQESDSLTKHKCSSDSESGHDSEKKGDLSDDSRTKTLLDNIRFMLCSSSAHSPTTSGRHTVEL